MATGIYKGHLLKADFYGKASIVLWDFQIAGFCPLGLCPDNVKDASLNVNVFSGAVAFFREHRRCDVHRWETGDTQPWGKGISLYCVGLLSGGWNI